MRRDGEEYGTPTTTFHANLKYVDDDGNVQGEGFDGQVLQAENTQLAQHWGFSSRPPEDTFLYVLNTASGERIVHENVWDSSLANGESKVWAKEGQYIYMKNGGQVDINAKPGQKVVMLSSTFLGSASATEKMLLGSQMVSDLTDFWDNWKTELNALDTEMQDIEGQTGYPWTTGWSTLTTAIRSYCTALVTEIDDIKSDKANWESSKHKLD